MYSRSAITYSVILLFPALNASFADENEAPVVTLPQGKIQGHVLQSPEGTTYYAYQEIPYAAPPVDELRFKEPQEPEKWNGILNTTHNTHSCYLNGREDEIAPDVTQGEDCLYLNVYTPLKPGSNSSPIPVLFWIHGGGYFFGDGTFQVYGPQFFIDFDIVIVTINYRLGAFGFLSTADGVIPGNLGLKDQNFAMQWVQKNINLFGGDPNKVTITGESAGGSSVGYHVISKKGEGLFRGAILQSGTAICSFGLQTHARDYAFQLGTIINPDFDSDNSTELLALLQNVPAAVINNITIEVPKNKSRGIGDDLVWVPIIENAEFDNAFISSPMHEDVKTGNVNQIPILIGYNSEEEIVFFGDDITPIEDIATKLDKDLEKVVNDKYNISDEDKSIAGGELRKLYTNGTFQEDFSAIVKFITDSDFATPIIQHAELQSNYADVYLYQFSYKGMMGCDNKTVEGVDTVGHSEDLKYLWHIDRLDDGSIFSVGDRLTQRRLLTLWSNFVKYLNPTPEEDPLLENVIWPTVTTDNIRYLNINRTLEVRTDPRKYKKFTEIVNKYANPPLYTY